MKKLVFVCLPFLALTCFAQSGPVTLTNPPSLAKPKGFSQAAIVDLGTCRMVIFSGQVSLDSQGNLVGKDDVSKQTEQIFQNIRGALADLGGTMNDLVKIGVLMTDVSKVQQFRTVRDQFVNVQAPPTSTLAQVSKLFRDDVLIEIEATAILPKKS